MINVLKFQVLSHSVLKFQVLFSFCSKIKCWLSRLGFRKRLVRIANREDPDQTASSEAVLKKQSDLGLNCLSRPF